MSSKSVGIQESVGAAWEQAVRSSIRGLRYGSVEIVVHDGRVVQIETREKVRFEEAGGRSPETRQRERFNDSRADRTTGAEAGAKAGETER